MLSSWGRKARNNIKLGWELYANKATGRDICPVARFYIYVICNRALLCTARAQKGSKGEVPGSFLSLFLDEYQEIALSQ